MPSFDLARQPRFSVRTIDTDLPLTENQLNELLNHNQGITLCVRSAVGHENRGGYFFCIQKFDSGNILLETIEGDQVEGDQVDKTFSPLLMLRLINHVCGLQFDNEMLLYCQNQLNFRSD